MRLVFDIDGVVCNNTWGEYKNAAPNQEVINIINKLFDEGNIIIFHSARGFGNLNGNLDEINNKWYEFTKNQLLCWGVRFHALYIGKPNADFYIDDHGIRFSGDTAVLKGLLNEKS